MNSEISIGLKRNKGGWLYAVGREGKNFNCGGCGLLMACYHECDDYDPVWYTKEKVERYYKDIVAYMNRVLISQGMKAIK